MSIGGMIYRALHRAPPKQRWLEPDIVYRRRLLLKLVDLRIDAMFLTGAALDAVGAELGLRRKASERPAMPPPNPKKRGEHA